jgi:hypothetical protein
LHTRIVLRNDTASNWLSNNPTLYEGEIGIETDTGLFKIGLENVSWKDLPYANKTADSTAAHYEIIAAEEQDDLDAIAAALGTITPKRDDIAIIKRLIAAEKYSYTAYVFNGENWAALDGNYNAENVFFDENITVTTAVGNISLSNGSGEIPAKGKNLKQVFEAIWTKENCAPTVTSPSIMLNVKGSNNLNTISGEVGTTYAAPVATASITSFGNYQFGSKDSNGAYYDPADTNVVFSNLQVGNAEKVDNLVPENSASITNVNSKSTVKTVSYQGAAGVFSDEA